MYNFEIIQNKHYINYLFQFLTCLLYIGTHSQI
jgi:hypothetical protein